MPMDFPDMKSLERAAEVHGFRVVNDGESEADYREALADYVKPRDFIESQEIRNKVGWDQWTKSQKKDMLARSGVKIVKECESLRVICKPKGSGKTEELIKRCAELGGCIVCCGKSECRRIKVVIQELYLEGKIDHIISYPITYDEFLRFDYHHVATESFHIDNADMLLQYMSKVPILTVTITC